MKIISFALERELVESFYRGERYRLALTRPLRSTLEYYLGFSVFFGLITVCYLYMRWLLPSAPVWVNLPKQLTNLYPDQLEILINNGSLSTNYSGPVVFSMDDLYRTLRMAGIRDRNKDAQLDKLLVIDTQAGKADIRNYRTYVLLTSDYLVYAEKSSNNEFLYRVIKYHPKVNISIDKRWMDRLAEKMTIYAQKMFWWLLGGLTLMLLLILPGIRLIHILILSTIVAVGGKMFGLKYRRLQYFQLTLQVYVVACVLVGLVIMGVPNWQPMRLTTSIVTLVGAVFALISLENHKVRRLN